MEFAASGAALPFAAVCLWRRRSALRWRWCRGAWRCWSGLFLVVPGIGPHGLDTLLRHGLGAPLQTAAVAATGSNLVNNLPA